MGQLVSLHSRRSVAASTDLNAVCSRIIDIEALYGVAVEDLMATIRLLDELDAKLEAMILELPCTASRATFETGRASLSSRIKEIRAQALQIAGGKRV